MRTLGGGRRRQGVADAGRQVRQQRRVVRLQLKLQGLQVHARRRLLQRPALAGRQLDADAPGAPAQAGHRLTCLPGYPRRTAKRARRRWERVHVIVLELAGGSKC